MRNNLTNAEKETTITFSDADSDAMVWSASDVMNRRIKKAGWKPERKVGRGEWYRIPKKFIAIRKPVFLTDERKAALRDRAKARFSSKRPRDPAIPSSSDASAVKRPT